jgi:hypothetical protein
MSFSDPPDNVVCETSETVDLAGGRIEAEDIQSVIRSTG